MVCLLEVKLAKKGVDYENINKGNQSKESKIKIQ